jgi:hypothetical protein
MKNEIIKILLLAIVGFLVGYGLGELIKADKKKQEKMEIQVTVDNFTHRYTDLCLDLNSKSVKLDTLATDYKRKQADLINAFILDSYVLYSEVYHYVEEKNLLEKNIKEYEQCFTVMESIKGSQMEAYKKMDTIYSITSPSSSVFLSEAEMNCEMAKNLTKKTCEEILKIDPNNQKVIETLSRL